jgi:HSP20 family molecular chaperone IbpA
LTTGLDWFDTDPFYNTSLTSSTRPLTTTGTTATDVSRPFAPCDIVESEKEYHFYVDLPGVEDIDISTSNGYLIVKGERKTVLDASHNEYRRRMERNYGRVRKRVLLPTDADTDQSNASFKNGVLCIVFPKKEVASQQSKKIEMKTD